MGTIGLSSAVGQQPEKIDFNRDILPILVKNCYECHGPDQQDGDLRFDDSTVALQEDFIIPNNSADSRMYEVLISEDDDRMPPPDEKEALPTEEIERIKAWIDQGAIWPAESVESEDPPQTSTKSADPPNQEKSQGVGDDSLPKTTNPANAPKPEAGKPLTPTQEFWVKVWRAFGDLHPAVSHFPIALFVVGGVFALISLRGSYSCADFAFYCLWLGALAALVAAFLGWSFAWNEGHREDPFLFDTSARLFWHRWSGVTLAILSTILALFATIARRRDPEDGTLWKLGLMALACLTVYVGHAGGELTHRRGYKKIFELFSNPAAVQPAAKDSPAAAD